MAENRVQLLPDVCVWGDDDHFIIVCTVCCSVCSILLFGILVSLTEKLNSVSDILELAVYTQCTPCVERPGLLLQVDV